MASQPPQSLRVRESAVLGYSRSAVWDLIRKLDFSVLTPEAVRTCVVEQGPAARVGSLRVATHKDGSVWSYRVTELSDVSRSIGYELYHMQGATAGSGGAPYSSAHTTISVLPVSCGSASGGCFVTWTTDFSSDAGVAVTATTRKTTRAAFNAMRSSLGASRFADNVAAFSVASLPSACRHVLMDDAFPVQGCVDDFLARGGKLMVIDDEVKPGKFLIAPSDHLFPVCSSGQNRSQVMRELLLQRTAGTKFTGHVALAHAAIAGVDPYVDDAMSATVATVDIDATMPAFAEEFGHPRDPRVGEAEFPFGGFHEAGDPFLLNAKAWFTENVYSRTESMPEGRRVYLCFEKPTHAVLKRLVEASIATGQSLDDVVVVSFPVGDVIAHPPEGLERNSRGAVRAAFQRWETLLDFSALA